MRDQISGLIDLAYHRLMLGDQARMSFFKKAISLEVRPGMSVVELGAGTGILSYLAARAGATVTAVEYDDTNHRALSRNIARNSLGTAITAVRADAMTFLPDAPVDVVICEMCHAGLMVERQVPVIASFMRRHFDRFGSSPLPVPSKAVLSFDLVNKDYDFDGFVARSVHYEDAYCNVENSRPAMCEQQIYHVVDLRECFAPPASCDRQGHFRVTSSGRANTVRLRMFVSLAGAIASFDDFWCLSNLNFPLEPELELLAGDTCHYSLVYEPGGPLGSFSFSLEAPPGASARSFL